MQPIDAIAIVGEVLSWIGLGVGLPILVVAGMVRLAEGRWEPVEIAIVERAGEQFARWFAGGDFHERPLAARERADDDWHHGVVSARDAGYVRLDPPMLLRTLLTLGAVFVAVGVIGAILALLPAFV